MAAKRHQRESEIATPLLTTKLYIPPVRPDPSTGPSATLRTGPSTSLRAGLRTRLVSRPRLIERLNAGLHRKLTLVSAPAGFGKTTLLSEWARPEPAEWVAGCGRPVAWLSLDEGDNYPAHFLAYFVAAVKAIDANFGAGTLGALQSSQPPPMEAVLTTLVNEIVTILDPLILVLDDYHLITAQPIHDGLAFLLDHLPPQMHLVIATRADPPLPLARLRARGQLTELRQSDLRFTTGEAAAFLNRVMGLDLSPDHVTALESRTEGWIAGLQMVSLAMQAHVSTQGQDDVAGFISDFIAAFTGSDRYILDYLVECFPSAGHTSGPNGRGRCVLLATRRRKRSWAVG